jgi:hypothetical protein
MKISFFFINQIILNSKRTSLVMAFVIASATANAQRSEIVKGDLYFALIDFGQFFDIPDSTMRKWEKEMSTYDSLDQRYPLTLLYLELVENGLSKTPYIWIVDEQDSIKRIFIDDLDYKELTRFNCWDLIEEGRKVEVTVKVKVLDLKPYPITEAIEPLAYKIVEGKTRHN